MKCPYCGREMTPGYIQSARRVYFTETPHELFFWPLKKDKTITRENIWSPTSPAYHCSNCKKVIVDYSGEKAEFR
ncbi:MAG: hypothetical protein II161_02495 [Erysipelotrichaceae bacterium]|nr:hypothetical protein [Erysipelotrichaceae bacterium]